MMNYGSPAPLRVLGFAMAQDVSANSPVVATDARPSAGRDVFENSTAQRVNAGPVEPEAVDASVAR